jgi:1,4-dihydroxy-2-naphthoyl-CoA synthase
MPGQVHYEKKDGVATLTLDNPKARNAFDYEMTQELRRRWAEISRDPEIVCAILTGAGEKAFCTGWDITSTASGESHKFSQGGRKAAPYSQITALQCRCWKPVITAVNGMCSGGGLHFVADGDIVIASETATFFDTHCEAGRRRMACICSARAASIRARKAPASVRPAERRSGAAASPAARLCLRSLDSAPPAARPPGREPRAPSRARASAESAASSP